MLVATGWLSDWAWRAGDWLRESEGLRAKLEAAETELEAARTGRAQADEKIEKLQQYMQVIVLCGPAGGDAGI